MNIVFLHTTHPKYSLFCEHRQTNLSHIPLTPAAASTYVAIFYRPPPQRPPPALPACTPRPARPPLGHPNAQHRREGPPRPVQAPFWPGSGDVPIGRDNRSCGMLGALLTQGGRAARTCQGGGAPQRNSGGWDSYAAQKFVMVLPLKGI